MITIMIMCKIKRIMTGVLRGLGGGGSSVRVMCSRLVGLGAYLKLLHWIGDHAGCCWQSTTDALGQLLGGRQLGGCRYSLPGARNLYAHAAETHTHTQNTRTENTENNQYNDHDICDYTMHNANKFSCVQKYHPTINCRSHNAPCFPINAQQ